MFGLFGKNEKKIDALIASKDYDQLPNDVIDQLAKGLILTTEFAMPEYRVTERLEIITAECVYGMNMFRDMFASIRDVLGGRSGASQKVLRDARKTCLTELRREALITGADAVIGVDLDYSEISGGGKSMLLVVASGTAVKLQEL
ncbi:MAG: YbjQ family protein [Magnetovibrio sp.]|nr:YbjQ family protein [Magnetovibrio sp.]